MDNILVVQGDDYLWLPIWRNAIKFINMKNPRAFPGENRIMEYNSFLLDYNAEFIATTDQRWYIKFETEADKLEFMLTYG
jgi:hypothetical protein